jgi:hypothetical protein
MGCNSYNEYRMVRPLQLIYLRELGHLQGIVKHKQHNQNNDRCLQRMLNRVLLPCLHEEVLVLNLSPRPPYFHWKQNKIDFVKIYPINQVISIYNQTIKSERHKHSENISNKLLTL